MFLRIPSFISEKNFDRTRSVGHGQNVVGQTPLSKLDGLSSNFQEMFLSVSSCAPGLAFDRKRSIGQLF